MRDSEGRSILISGEYPFLAARLREWGTEVISTPADKRLPGPVQFHPDMQLCVLGKTMFVLRDGPLQDILKRRGFRISETERTPANEYPGDVLCNAFTLDGFLVGNPLSMDPKILLEAKKQGLKELAVRQGYAACSAAVVNEHSVITADKGIEAALKKAGLETLLIQPGFLDLPGYDTGFFGGCCGLLRPDLMAFSGSLDFHPDGKRIRRFLKTKGIKTLELSNTKLLDIGGIVVLNP